MTECEKLLNKGFISEKFLCEEEICGYKVDMEMKKLWALELDLLEEFKRICAKYNLSYYALGGTLLGAVRHKGFIPWDDDIDVCMPREDYELLTTVYADEFKDPYFMQTPYTDKEYAFSFAKIRNTQTCFASQAFIESSMNQGVFLDIFPLDNSMAEGLVERRTNILAVLRKCSAYMSRNNLYIKNRHTDYAENLVFSEGDNVRFYETIQNIAKKCQYLETDNIALEVLTMYSPEKTLWKRECYFEYDEVPFSNTYIRVPKDYDSVLTTMFKNYMEFPPVESRGVWHDGVIKDMDNPFNIVREKMLKELYTKNLTSI